MSNETFGNTEYELTKGTRFVYNNTNWEAVNVDDTALTIRNLDSENQMESLTIEDWQNAVKRGEVEFIAEKENSPVGTISLSDQLVNITDMIIIQKKEITDLVADNDFTNAAAAAQKLAELNSEAKNIKAQLQAQEITVADVDTLRSILPARKSVQNMLEREVAQTPKFEKLLSEELGAKSAYKMRNSDNEWRKDKSKTVPVIEVNKRERPENLAEIRKRNDIPRGTFINRDTGIEIMFSRRSIEETIANAMHDDKRNISVEARMAALYQMKDVVENAVCFDSQLSEPSSSRKSENTLFIHRMYGVFNYDNESYLFNMAVEETYATDKDDRFRDTSNRLYNFDDIKITPVKLLGGQAHAIPQNASTDTSTDVIKISIPQLYNLVKSYDEYFYENFKAAGRSDREAEIEAQKEFSKAMEILAKKGIFASLSQNEFIEKVEQVSSFYSTSNSKSSDEIDFYSSVSEAPQNDNIKQIRSDSSVPQSIVHSDSDAAAVMSKPNPLKNFIDNLKSILKKQDNLPALSVQAEEQPEIIKNEIIEENTVSSKLDELIEARTAFAEEKITMSEYKQALENYMRSLNGREMWTEAANNLRKQLEECPDNLKKCISFELKSIELNIEKKFPPNQTLNEIKRAAHEQYDKMQNEKSISEKEKSIAKNKIER